MGLKSDWVKEQVSDVESHGVVLSPKYSFAETGL